MEFVPNKTLTLEEALECHVIDWTLLLFPLSSDLRNVYRSSYLWLQTIF